MIINDALFEFHGDIALRSVERSHVGTKLPRPPQLKPMTSSSIAPSASYQKM